MKKLLFVTCIFILSVCSKTVSQECTEQSLPSVNKVIDGDVLKDFKRKGSTTIKLAEDSLGDTVQIYTKKECINGQMRTTEEFYHKGFNWTYTK